MKVVCRVLTLGVTADRFFFEKRKSCDANGPDCRTTQETLDVGRTKNSRQVAQARANSRAAPLQGGPAPAGT